MTMDGMDVSILGPAFLAGLLVLSTHVPLGREVLRRGIIFIDLAIAQIAGLGVIAAHVLHLDESGAAVQIVAYSAALAGALLLYACERRWPDVQEAIIGSVFIVAASTGVMLLASSARAGEYLQDLLVGQILWVDYASLLPVAILYAGALALWYLLRNRQRSFLFYVLFAVVVTASVQLVGIYLVFASLIIPALAVRDAKRHATLYAWLLGLAAYASGLVISALLDLPTGAVIVLCLAGMAVLARLVVAIRKRSGISAQGADS